MFPPCCRQCRPLASTISRASHSYLPNRKMHGNVSDTSFRRLLSRRIARRLPSFPVNAKDTTVIREPSVFYRTLLDMIYRARKHIFISSLYIGHEEHELFTALDEALRRNPNVTLNIQVDKRRTTRPGFDSPVLPLVDLLRSHPDRVNVYLFSSPNLKGILKWLIPPRYDEGWGTWHVKCYGVDDEVIISGANLNGSYFTNRQDRYIHFRAQPQLVAYCSAFLHLCAKFSYRLAIPRPNSFDRSFELVWQQKFTSPDAFAIKAQESLIKFQRGYLDASTEANEDADSIVFPYIQSGVLGIFEEEYVLAQIFKGLKEYIKSSVLHRPLMHLTTGYFALHRPYQRKLIECPVDCNILVASPEANGFFRSRGLSKLIPEAYTLMENDFWRRVEKAGRHLQEGGIVLREWWRKGWTYHAKGIWLSPSSRDPPHFTLFGSSNLSSRSANLDTELGFALFTNSYAFREELQREVEQLYEPSSAVSSKTWRTKERKVGPLAWILVRTGVEDML